MTVARPGDPFHLDLEGTVLDGRYLEVDPPHRLLIEWERPGTDEATSASALAEITLTPTANGTSVTVRLSGLPGDELDSHLGLWTRHLDRIADVFVVPDGRPLDDWPTPHGDPRATWIDSLNHPRAGGATSSSTR